jgi:hypothetical protein
MKNKTKRKEQEEGINLYLNQTVKAAAWEITKLIRNFIAQNSNSEIAREFLKQLSDRHIKTMISRNIFIPAGRSFFSCFKKIFSGFCKPATISIPSLWNLESSMKR